MKRFKDTAQREWMITIDIGQIKAVRDLAKVDLYSLFAEEAKRLFSDPCLLVDVLYVLCRKQCEERKMSDEDFGKAFDGQVLEAAADALLEAVVNFFPPSRQTILRATVEKAREITEPMQAEILKRIQAISVTDLLMPTVSPAS